MIPVNSVLPVILFSGDKPIERPVYPQRCDDKKVRGGVDRQAISRTAQ